jgi:hypothetical protein
VKVSYCLYLLKVPKVFAAVVVVVVITASENEQKENRMLLAVRLCLSIAPITTH